MRVRCITNMGRDIPPEFLAPDDEECRGDAVLDELRNEAFYTVYAMTIQNGHVWYYVCGENRRIPYWYPCSMFEIVDGRLSRYWEFNYIRDERPYGVIHIETWAFPEWARDDTFYERLLDRCDEAQRVFEKYSRAMNLEFPTTDTDKTAEQLEGKWVQCPHCADAWETLSTFGMLECPSCHVLSVNPGCAESELE